jgi:hypothetical protein
MWDVWWTKWHCGRFSPSTSISPVNLHSTRCRTITIIWVCYNRAIVAEIPSGLCLTPTNNNNNNNNKTAGRWHGKSQFRNISWYKMAQLFHSFINGSTALCWALAAFFFFSFVMLYTVGRTPLTGDQPIARPLPTHKYTINAYRHPCLQWDSNPGPQCSSGRRQFMPQTAWLLWSAV